MNYYKLIYDYENDADAICCFSKDLSDMNQYSVMQGLFIDSWNDKITLYYDNEEGNRKTDFLGNDMGWFIVSEKFKQVLNAGKIEGIQYLPLNIKNVTDNKPLEGYSVANVYNLADARDLNHSKYNEFEIDENKKILSIMLYALRKEKIGGLDIFKLKNDAIPIFVSEKFVDSIAKNAITGCSFLEVKVI